MNVVICNTGKATMSYNLLLPWPCVQAILLKSTVKSQDLTNPSPLGLPHLKTSAMQANRKVKPVICCNIREPKIYTCMHYTAGQLTAPTIELKQEELQVAEGERVTLTVEASGSPQPTITWAREGKEVEADYATELGEDGSLTLVCVESKHAGTYHFTASNEAGCVEGIVTLIVSAEEQLGEGSTGLATVENSPLEVEQFGEAVSCLHECNNAGFILQFKVYLWIKCAWLPLMLFLFKCSLCHLERSRRI